MKTTFFSSVTLLLTMAFLPGAVQAQETPQEILKKAAIRVERAKTYQFHARMVASSEETGEVTARMEYLHEGKKTRMEMGKIVRSKGLAFPEDTRVIMLRDGKQYCLTFTGYGAYVSKDDNKEPENGSFLPVPKDLDRLGCTLFPPQIVEGKTVNPIRVEYEDKTEITYYIEAVTYRLIQIQSKPEVDGKRSEVKFIIESETLNAKLPPETFKFVPPANAKPMPASLSKANPFALLTGAFSPGSSK